MDTSSTEAKLANAKSVLTTVASVAGTLMLARSVALDFLPRQFQEYVFFNIYRFFSRFSTQLTIVVDEYDGFVKNEIYDAANVYLGSTISPSTQRLKVTKPDKENDFTVKMEQGVEIVDVYQGVKFKWVLVCRQVERRNFHNRRDFNASLISETRSFRVSFPKKHKNMVLQSYFPHIVKEGKSIKREKRTPKIFTVDYNNRYGNPWGAMNLDHPSKFDTLALDMKVKDMILKDLGMFVKRKDYYVKVGKAWKRGYLLYGPPGTGKSSLIAAMANYLNFDIYELELTEVRSNSHLKRLLLATANRSILVVEDIDCTIEFHDRFAESRNAQTRRNPPENLVTLSGFLNFLDGLWSSCGDERIIVFTTNHKDKLDPALLRPGRIDVHIHMSYCTPHSFKVLAANYLGIKDHRLFGEVEDLIRATEVTPAEVAEQLLRSDEIVTVLNELIEFLILKKKKNEETKAKVKQVESAVEGKGKSVGKDNKVDDEGKAAGS